MVYLRVTALVVFTFLAVLNMVMVRHDKRDEALVIGIINMLFLTWGSAMIIVAL